MSLYSLKPKFQNCLRPITRAWAARGITANQVTLGAALGSIVAGALAAASGAHRWLFLLIPVWLFLRMALNAIDGMLAREHGQKSVLGAYLNELGDVVSDLALVLPFLTVPGLTGTGVWAFALVAVMVECAGLIGPLAGASRRYDGPVGKSDRALALGAFALWVGLGWPIGTPGVAIWWALIALGAVTLVRRVRAGVTEAQA